MKLTQVERQMLYNQYQILSIICPEERDSFELKMAILYNGYESDYGDVVNVCDELGKDECEFVYDVLSMFRDLCFSYRELGDKSGILKKDVVFQGFDGNNETEYYSFASFLLKDKELYREFDGVSVNSHARRVEIYERMLNIYKPISDEKIKNYRDYLTKEEIISIINARKRT